MHRSDFDKMVREVEQSPHAELLEVRFGAPASDGTIATAVQLAGATLPEGVEALYRQMNGFYCKWRISRARADLLRKGNAPEGIINLLPLVNADPAIFNDWLGVVWEEEGDFRELVKPFDYQVETCAAFYPVPGDMKVYYHEVVRDIYPTGYSFAEYIQRLLVARGLFVFRTLLCRTFHSPDDAIWLKKVVTELFGESHTDLIKPGDV